MEFDLGRLLTEESKRMMNCLHEGIFIADKMGNIVFANQALLEMAGGTEEYALSLNVFDFKKQGVDVNKDQLLAQRALETKRRITRISEVKITTGYSYRQLGTATPLLDDEGEIQYIVVEMQTLDHLQRTYQDGLYEQREDFREEVKKDSSPFICVNPNLTSILNMAKRIADILSVRVIWPQNRLFLLTVLPFLKIYLNRNYLDMNREVSQGHPRTARWDYLRRQRMV